MRFKEPSPQDHFFQTPAAARPDINLNVLAAQSQELPVGAASIDTGVTRWFDLVYGFALDGAVREGYSVQDINDALAAGELLARTFFFQASREDGASSKRQYPQDFTDNEAAFLGTVEADEDLLYVSGGPPKEPPNSVMYRKRGDAYTAFLSQVVREAGADVQSVPMPEPYVCSPNKLYMPATLPNELQAAYSLGVLANVATFHLDARNIIQRGRVYLGPK